MHSNHFRIFCHFSVGAQYVLNRTKKCHSFSSSLYFCVLKREILFLYPGELHLFPIIVQDGYLFAKYKSGVLGDKCTKDPSWGLRFNSLLYSLLPPHPIKLSHSSHKSQWNYTVEKYCTFRTLWKPPVGWKRLAQLNTTALSLHCPLTLLGSGWDGNKVMHTPNPSIISTDPDHTYVWYDVRCR